MEPCHIKDETERARHSQSSTGLERIMPATRGYETILRDIDKNMKKLSDDWLRVQTKKRRARNESVKKRMKSRMDLILKVIRKMQQCRGTLVRANEQFGNSVQRQRVKEEMESVLPDLEQLTDFFSKF